MRESEFFRQPAQVLDYIKRAQIDLNVTKLSKEFKVYQGNMAKMITGLVKIADSIAKINYELT